MEHTSRMLRLTLMGGQARVFLCDTTEMAQQARDIHEASNTCSAAMGRMLAATAIMGANLKSDGDRITATINGGGPAGPICAIAGPDGTVKVTIEHPEVELPLKPNGKLDVGGALGKDGQLTVMRSFGFGEPYVGRVALVSGEIAEDITNYYATSEQINSSVALGVLMEKNNTVKQAGGFILQLMPFTEDAVIDKLEENVKKLPSVTTMLEEGETPEGMIRRVLDGFDVEFYEETPTGYVCDCSKERVERAIISIGKKEIQDMIDDQKPIEVNCHFCGRHYEFSVDDLKHLLKKAVRA